MVLEVPKNIDAKQLIDKATILGFCVLKDDQVASIYSAEAQIGDAQVQIKNADQEITKSEQESQKAQTESNNAKAKEKETNSKSSSAPTENSVNAKQADVNSVMSASKARTQNMSKLGQSAVQGDSIFNGYIDNSLESINGFTIEITSIQKDNERLIAENQALMAELNKEEAGSLESRMNSADTLLTGAEAEELRRKNDESGNNSSSKSSIQAKIEANNATIESNGAKVENLNQQAQAQGQAAEAKKSEAQTQINEMNAQASEAQSAAEEDSSILETIGNYANLGIEIGNGIQGAGETLKAVGIGVTVTGTALSATGAGVTTLGATVAGIGAGVTALGIPLTALFGIGVPIVGAGGTTTASGTATGAAGVATTGSGAGIISVGSTIQATGKYTELTGKGIVAASRTVSAGVKFAKGDLVGGVKTTVAAVGNIASFGKSLDRFKDVKDKLETVSNIASSVKNGIASIESFVDDDIAGGTSSLLSSVAYGAKLKNKAVSEGFNAASALVASGQDIYEGNYVDATLEGMQAVANIGGAKAYHDANKDSSSKVEVFNSGNKELDTQLNKALTGNDSVKSEDVASFSEKGAKTFGRYKKTYDAITADPTDEKRKRREERNDIID